MEEILEILIPLFESYGLGGVATGVLAYGVLILRKLAKGLEVNPSLGHHLNQIGADLKTIKSATAITAKIAEKTWDKVNAKL